MSGIFGTISQDNCIKDLFYGVDYHSHMGTEYAGLAVLNETFIRHIHGIHQSQFKSKFFDDYHALSAKSGIGAISDSDEQPIYLNSKFGQFCIVTVGLIENKDKLVESLLDKGVSFSEVKSGGVNVTELIAKIITQGKNLVDGIEKMFSVIDGSCSLLVLTEEGIYAARDRFGYTPLVIGKKSGGYAVASETVAFSNLDFDIEKYLAPGEIVLIKKDGLIEKKAGAKVNKICTFLWIYTGFPASTYEGINTEVVRERCGRALAKHDKDIEADIVSGVPDSGVAHALGYAIESRIPYKRPLVKYTPGYGRSYT
ncbi:MAG: amidophosphoribosyltransferase, partial [Candidatus Omnitrophica bacterium]|nr:amidophosphoribosyltransferase [Candidatus Omnitrophota bacterium]